MSFIFGDLNVGEKERRELLGLMRIGIVGSIKEYLLNHVDYEYPHLFTWFLAMLYKGNGYVVKVLGQGTSDDVRRDILLSHKDTPSKPFLIVRGVNQSQSVDFNLVRDELVHLEKTASIEGGSDQFNLVSVGGFSRQAFTFSQFNMSMNNWTYIEQLIARFRMNEYVSPNGHMPGLELFAHNLRAYDRTVELFLEGHRMVSVNNATGTGKSYVMARILQDYAGSNIAVLAPSYYILDRHEKLLRRVLNLDKVNFFHYSAFAGKSNDELGSLQPDVIVLDEYHRCGAKVWGAGVRRLLDMYPQAKVVGLSATPIRHLDNGRDMKQELFNGVSASEISLGEAIQSKILPNPKYIASLYAIQEEVSMIEKKIDNSNLSPEEREKLYQDLNDIKLDWEKTSGVCQILGKHLDVNIGKMIVFCQNKTHLREMKAKVIRWIRETEIYDEIISYHVMSGEALNDQNFQNFYEAGVETGKLHLCFSIEMLNEGIHAPGTGAVMLLRKTASERVYLQQIARCIEASSSDEPIIFDLVNNFNNIQVGFYRDELLKKAEIRRKRREVLGLDDNSQDVVIFDYIQDVMKVLKIISDDLGVIRSFDEWFELIQEYVARYGDANIRRDYVTEDGIRLGLKVIDLRCAKDRLSDFQIKKLESIFGWKWRVNRKRLSFDEWFKKLQKYVIKYENATVPRNYITEDNFKLGAKVNHLRCSKNKLSKKQIEKLESLSEWKWSTRQSPLSFDEWFDLLREHGVEHGNVFIPQDYVTEDGLKLGQKIVELRRVKNKLSKKQIEKLESLPGWRWQIQQSPLSFDEWFDLLREHGVEHGNVSISQDYVTEDGFKLGQKISSLRSKKETLTEEQIKKLESLPGWKWGRKNKKRR